MITLDILVSIEPKKPLVNTFGGQRWEIISQTPWPPAQLINWTKQIFKEVRTLTQKGSRGYTLGQNVHWPHWTVHNSQKGTSWSHLQMCNDDRSCNQLVWDPSIQRQTSNHCRQHSRRGMVFPLPLANPSHLIEVLNSLAMNFRRCWMIIQCPKYCKLLGVHLHVNNVWFNRTIRTKIRLASRIPISLMTR